MRMTYFCNGSEFQLKSLSDNNEEYPYGTQINIPQSFPNHFYNTNKFSPLFLALQ